MRKRPTTASAAHHALVTFWCETWAAAHDGARYPFNGGKDAATVSALQQMVPDDATLRHYMEVYVALEDAWMTSRGHSLAVLRACLPQVIEAARHPVSVPRRLRGLREWIDE